jgi:hypothetical protein
MKMKRNISITLIVAVLAAMSLSALLPESASAALPAEDSYSGLQQPPPPPPPPPPPGGSDNVTNDPGATGQQPPQPTGAPTPGKPLPDPNLQPVAPTGASASTFAISTDELEVVADKGCPSQYKLNDPIQFIARRGPSTASGYWLYMEIWNSTNNAWWSKLASNWVEPGGSISRSGRIAEPVGQEQLYSRLIDQYGNVVQEAWCEYSTSATPVYPSIQCNQTDNRNVAINEENKYSFYGVGGRQVQINMVGPNGLDTYVELIAPNGKVVASNDDVNAPWDLNSRIQTVLPTTGTYTILARGFKHQAGQYSLSVFCN